MVYKYGDFSSGQINETKQMMRKKIFFLLLCVDPKTKNEYNDVDINAAFKGLLHEFGGLNSILFEPPELVRIISLLEAAQIELNNPSFQFNTYRKLVLDAGSEVLKIKEV